MGRSEELFERAVKRIPGGVNSPVRAYGAIGMAPRFIKRLCIGYKRIREQQNAAPAK